MPRAKISAIVPVIHQHSGKKYVAEVRCYLVEMAWPSASFFSHFVFFILLFFRSPEISAAMAAVIADGNLAAHRSCFEPARESSRRSLLGWFPGSSLRSSSNAFPKRRQAAVAGRDKRSQSVSFDFVVD